jgi:hypothetical protein
MLSANVILAWQIKIEFFPFFVRFNLLYFNLKNNREKLQSHHITVTVQNLGIKINVHF